MTESITSNRICCIDYSITDRTHGTVHIKLKATKTSLYRSVFPSPFDI